MIPLSEKTKKLRSILYSDKLHFLMEGHNALSARISEEAGFDGIWASSLTISSAMGVRDSNEVSWTQVLEVAELMSDVTTAPILLDGDTGYGNFNNTRRLVRKLEQRGIAGVCIEDKLFPKTNSFISSEKQELADIDEFAGKIKAAKDVQTDPNFCVVARIESFIAGWGLAETLKRAEAYYKAGADALLIHSKKSTPDEILQFMKEWGKTLPVVIVPTKYYKTPTEVFQQAGISTVIWANHMLRASVTAMQATAKKIHEEKTLINIEDSIATLTELFRLQGADELEEAEKRYLPKEADQAKAFVLAASRGIELGELTETKPKAMLKIHGDTILGKQVKLYNEIGIKEINVIVGYQADSVQAPGITKVLNAEYEKTKELASLSKALNKLQGSVVISYGDILLKKHLLTTLFEAKEDITIVVEAEPHKASMHATYKDYVKCSSPYQKFYNENKVKLLQMGDKLPQAETSGEWVGMLYASEKGTKEIKQALEVLMKDPQFSQLRMKDLFNHLISKGSNIAVQYVMGGWLDVDDLSSYSEAMEF